MKKYDGYRVTFMACSECNEKCKHCYISYSGHRVPEELESSISMLKDKYRIKVNGAEPLINPEYLSSYKKAEQKFILTNGIEIYKDPNLIQKIKANGIEKIYMSYHFGMHEKISNIPKNIIVENIKNIHKCGLKVYLMTTLSQSNYRLVESICEEAHLLQADGIMFNNYLLQGNAIDDVNLILNKNELAIVALEIEKSRLKYQRSEFDICKCGSLGANLQSEHNHFKCIAGIDQAVIAPDNKVYPCFFLTKPGFEIGYFDGNSIYITDPIEHDGSECISYNILNKKMKNRYYK